MPKTRRNRQRGGSCSNSSCLKGGYKATAKNREYLRKWRRGESIGFTMTASLKAKGLIPRSSGKKIVSAKYR